MAKQDLLTHQKKEWAKELYIRGNNTQKDIALKVGVTEKTMSNWVNDGKWDGMRKTLLSTKQEQLNMLYEMLDLLNKEGVKSLQDNDPNTMPDADRIIKLTNSIKKLENSTGIGEMIDALTALISFVQKEDFEASKLINIWSDRFIKDRLSTIKN